MRISILGAGSWGTALALTLSKNNHNIKLFTIEKEDAHNILNTRINSRFLPNILLPQNIDVTMNLEIACKDSDVIVLAVPSHAIRQVCCKLKQVITENQIIVNLAKGFEEDSFSTMSQVVFDVFKKNIKYIALSGPNLSSEIAKGLPAAASISGTEKTSLQLVQNTWSSKSFKLYTNDDLIGLEVGGSTKNVIAIASGFVEGKGLGTNTRAQLITRGMAEIVRLGVALGAKEKTFLGLSGLGDLVTTCFSQSSRNFSFGYKVGKGMSVQDALNSTHMVIEGIRTCKVLYKLSCDKKIDMPITREIYKGIYENKSPEAVLESLSNRELKSE